MMRVLPSAIVVVLFLFPQISSAQQPLVRGPQQTAVNLGCGCEVVKVYRGDEMEISRPNGGLMRIHLYGVDTPSLEEYPWGEKARRLTQLQVGGKNVLVRFHGRDSEGRMMATVEGRHGDLGKELIKDGLAVHDGIEAPERDDYGEMQISAMDSNEGMWKNLSEEPAWAPSPEETKN